MSGSKKADRMFWIVVGTILLVAVSAYQYARYRIAQEQQRQDLIAEQFIYVQDESKGSPRLVPKDNTWKENIEQINARYGK